VEVIVDSPRRQPAVVVDLQRYREARRPGTLPLFDGTGPAAATTATGTTAVIPARPRATRLNAAQVEHRHRMLRFLLGR
jgi:hypothetical protein